VAAAHKPTLLLVEDDPADLRLLRDALSGAGYTVHTASGAQDALREIAENTVDLILSPALDLLNLVRATHDPSELPVILLVDDRKAKPEELVGLERGANDCISKPIDLELMLARVSSLLQRKRAEESTRDHLERYELIARGSQDGIWDWHLRKNHFYLSPTWKKILGYHDNEVANLPEEWTGNACNCFSARSLLTTVRTNC
jgi:PleD family two-component response regulator